MVMGPRHCGRSYREQDSAKAITCRVDFLVGDDGADRVKRGHDAQAPVIVQRQIAVLGRRVAPGNAKHRVSLLNEITDQRIVRREVQNVVFHDPGRHDQDRFGHNRFGDGGVLDQLNQMVSENDLPRRDRHVAADNEAFGPHREPAGGHAD